MTLASTSGFFSRRLTSIAVMKSAASVTKFARGHPGAVTSDRAAAPGFPRKTQVAKSGLEHGSPDPPALPDDHPALNSSYLAIEKLDIGYLLRNHAAPRSPREPFTHNDRPLLVDLLPIRAHRHGSSRRVHTVHLRDTAEPSASW